MYFSFPAAFSGVGFLNRCIILEVRIFMFPCFKKGRTRSWTTDLLICSQPLYHWAIHPEFQICLFYVRRPVRSLTRVASSCKMPFHKLALHIFVLPLGLEPRTFRFLAECSDQLSYESISPLPSDNTRQCRTSQPHLPVLPRSVLVRCEWHLGATGVCFCQRGVVVITFA